MKTILFLAVFCVVGCASQEPTLQPVTKLYPAPAPVPAASAQNTETFVYDQKPLQGQLVAPEQTQSVIEKFKTVYAKMNQPRMLLYVNRELVDEKTGMKLIARTEKTESTRRNIDSTVDAANRPSNSVNINAGGNVTVNGSSVESTGKGQISDTTDRVTNENRYRLEERDSKLADRQTVRDVERLFGRPLRAAGASLADQGVATQMIADRQIKSFVVNTGGDAARKDRQALSKFTDVVVEILISSRTIASPAVSGESTRTVPDIQATAIRLKDSKIIGQASSRDAGRFTTSFDVQDMSEATALVLMEDIATNAE